MFPACFSGRVVPLKELARDAQVRCEQWTSPGQLYETPVPGLHLIHAVERVAFRPQLYRPSICVVLQGAKATTVGSEVREAAAGDLIVVSHHVPVAVSFTDASPARPYVALVLEVDLAVARELGGQMHEPDQEAATRASLDVGSADEGLLQAFARLLELLGDVEAARMLGPSVVREIHYRILRSPQGATLRELLRGQSQSHRIARATEYLRHHFRERLSMCDVAELASMSASTFHEHFKTFTGTSPLRFQKELRLFEARSLLRSGGFTVTEAALDVGYESVSQFSREYSRKFGRPPRDDRPTGMPQN